MLRKNFGSFDRDVQEISSKITHHWKEVDVVANATNLAEAKIARQAEELERALQRQTELNKWLAPANVDDDLHRLLSSYAKGSCDWVLRSPPFERLETASKFHALQVTGHPGGGKSTAAAHLVDQLLATTTAATEDHGSSARRRIVLRFFCKASDPEKTFASTILRTFSFQLLQACPDLAPAVQQAFCRSGRPVLDSETECLAVFESLISQAVHLSSSIYIVLDAVDECRDAPKLLQALLERPRAACLPLKVVLLSREDPDLRHLLRTCDDSLALHSRQEALERYIQTRVARLSITAHIDDALREELVSSIVDTSAGLWLFARLLLDEIERAPSPEEVTRQLQHVPHGMIELYTSILQARETKFSPTQLKMVQQLYLWLDKSDYIPARFWRGTSGDSIDDETIDLLFKYACQSSTIFNPARLIQDMCTPLVTTTALHSSPVVHHNNGNHDHAADYVAEFFHQTAKQYLSWSTGALSSVVPDSLRLRRLGHLHRGVFATWYFTECQDFQRDLQQLKERPREGNFGCMMEICCALWRALDVAATLPKLVKGHEEEAAELCEQLTWFISTDRCLAFIEVTFILNFTSQFDNSVSAIISLLTHTPKQVSAEPPAYSREALPPALQKLEAAHAILLADLAWIISTLRLSRVPANKPLDMPVGFKDRHLAQKIRGIACKWQWLNWAPMAVSSNSFLISPKR